MKRAFVLFSILSIIIFIVTLSWTIWATFQDKEDISWMYQTENEVVITLESTDMRTFDRKINLVQEQLHREGYDLAIKEATIKFKKRKNH